MLLNNLCFCKERTMLTPKNTIEANHNQKYTNTIFSCYGGASGALKAQDIIVVCTIVEELERYVAA